MLLCYSPYFQFGYPQLNSDDFDDTATNYLTQNILFKNISYPSFWSEIEIPSVDGILYLSPLKTVGTILQNISTGEKSSDELYTKLVLLMRQNLNNVNILSTNSTKSPAGYDINTIEYIYGSDSKKFKIQQILESGENRTYLLTYFAEDVFYDRFLPVISTMKDSLFNSEKNKNHFTEEPVLENNTIMENRTSASSAGSSNIELESKTKTATLSQNEDRTLTYSNPFLGITLEYPSTLKKIEGDNGISFFFDKGTAGIIVGVIPSSSNSLDRFTTEHISDFKSKLQNFTVANTSKVNLFTNPTQMLFFNYNNNSVLYKGMEYITLEGTDAYVFSYFSRANTFDSHLSLFSDFVESTQLRTLPRIS
jgi:hypothetical protein